MQYLVYLLLSAIIIIGVHGYLLITQKPNRKPTISEHASLHNKSMAVYIVGHILGGAFFLFFAKKYYFDILGFEWLFWISVWAVFFEYVQAIIPAKGTTIKPHTIAAMIMWASIIMLGFLSIIYVPATPESKMVASLLFGLLIRMVILARKNRDKLYLYQMKMTMLFYASLFVLVM